VNIDDLTASTVERAALETPDRIAIQDAGGGRITYGELQELSLRWVQALQRAGAAPRDRIALMLTTSASAFTVQLAVGQLGGTVVALNTVLRGDLLTRAINTTECTVVVTERDHFDQIATACADLPRLRSVVLLDSESVPPSSIARDIGSLQVVSAAELLSTAEARSAIPPDLADIQGIIFTSGTTGPSKAVMLSHEFFIRCARQLIPGGLDARGGAYYSPWPLGHSLGSLALAAAADRGVRLVLRDKFTVDQFWRDVRDFDCRTSVLVSVGGALWGAPSRQDDADNPLRYVAVTPLISEYARFATRFAVQVSGLYGTTELGPVLTSDRPAHYKVSGKPAPDYECRLIDANGVAVADGVPGELIVRSSSPRGLMSGYAQRAGSDEPTFPDGWFHTGDLFIRESTGDYCFVDRIKDSIRRRGQNISSFEVESEAMNHPSVSQCAAVGVPVDFTSGAPHAEEEVKLFVVLRSGADLTPAELGEFLKSRLPRYMVPRYLEFCDSLPTTETTRRPVKAILRDLPNGAATYDRYRSTAPATQP
jgi:carnitine-CoA ligase